MILFFDRSVGVTIPRNVLNLRRLNFPHQVQYHESHFEPGTLDDEWMPTAAENGWTVIGHDQYHRGKGSEANIFAIKQYGLGCFYLWGAEAKNWSLAAIKRTAELLRLSERPDHSPDTHR